ncbi:MAG: type II CAAX endopeptidase family protein [bacterium]
MQSNFITRFQLPIFFISCLIISWVVWIPQAITILNSQETTPAGSSPLNVLAVWAPGIVALILSRIISGKSGPNKLFGQLRRWRVGIQWYLLVLFYPAALWLAALMIDRVLGHSYHITILPIMEHFGPNSSFMIPIAFISVLPNTLCEELGWRGFALPKLQKKNNALISSLILGLFWGIWHIPMWMGLGQTGMDLLLMVINTIGAALLYTWIYNSTNGSLLLVWLFHFSMVVTQYLVSSLPTYTKSILSWIIVLIIVVTTGPKKLSLKKVHSGVHRQ